MDSDPLSADEKNGLLRLARRSLEMALARRGPLRQDEIERILRPSGHLLAKRGAFVTLQDRHGELRGCIGHVSPLLPLYLTVADCAFGAAVRDPRFDPVTREELAGLRIEISVLTEPRRISPGETEVNRHGLIVRQHGRTGLLLPQVATENHWDRESFLSMTCQKAGLPETAWKEGAEVLAFEAEVFGEAEPGASRPGGRA